VKGVGEKWLFSATSRSFGYGYEAVRIRVKFLYKRQGRADGKFFKRL
jgi:hypothetical protein